MQYYPSKKKFEFFIVESLNLAEFEFIWIFEISQSVPKIHISKTVFNFFLQWIYKKIKILTYCAIKLCKSFIFGENKMKFFFPKKKRYQVIYKYILTAIGQNITVPQSCNVAGWCIDPWRIMGFKETKSLNTFFIRFLCANVFP